jgi:outer membrane receptor protein involved in Fe transport
VDLQLTYRIADTWGLHSGRETKLALSVQNLFDRNPPFVAAPASAPYSNVGFDALNASPLGRFVALQLSKDW